jgi:hypothetical protein
LDRLTVAYLIVVVSSLVFVLRASIDVWFPFVDQATHTTWFPFLPPLVGSLFGVFVANWLEHRRARTEREKESREKEERTRCERSACLASIRTELEQNMIHLKELTPDKVILQHNEHLVGTEKVQTDTWESCINSGKTMLLRPEQRGDIGAVYRLLQDYNEKVSRSVMGVLPPLDYGERIELAEEIIKVLSKSQWTSDWSKNAEHAS